MRFHQFPFPLYVTDWYTIVLNAKGNLSESNFLTDQIGFKWVVALKQ